MIAVCGRDVALLGVLHRAAIGHGPPQLRNLFKRRYGSLTLIDRLENVRPSILISRSIWGLVRVYFSLGGALECKEVKNFQMLLQAHAKRVAVKGLLPDWHTLYTPSW